MIVNSNFDSGNIEVNSISESEINLSIRKDNNFDFLQWFYFSFSGEKNKAYNFNISNAGKTSYTKGWENYNVCASYDRKNWFRVKSSFNGESLTFSHKIEKNTVYYAYFAPYTYERHLDLVADLTESSLTEHIILGKTIDGRNIDLIKVGKENESKKNIWIIARQHPGETMAEWFMEGLAKKLLDTNDPVSRELLNKFVFYLVPNMNPDGSFRGNLRTNTSGANLNREWQNPSIEKSPEVFYVRKKMVETGMEMFFDIHGDEGLPYNFVACCEGIPSYNEVMAKKEADFIKTFMSVSPDFQNTYGYEKDKPSQANLTIATPNIGESFGVLSLTLEMPFKDNANAPDEKQGWSPEKCIKLGESMLTAILLNS
ncbi:MAG: M14-type cytosolic carboxypeptidase [Candidatus Sericytochromatia bacterium]